MGPRNYGATEMGKQLMGRAIPSQIAKLVEELHIKNGNNILPLVSDNGDVSRLSLDTPSPAPVLDFQAAMVPFCPDFRAFG